MIGIPHVLQQQSAMPTCNVCSTVDGTSFNPKRLDICVEEKCEVFGDRRYSSIEKDHRNKNKKSDMQYLIQ
jgi:hypothetical protein